MVTRDKSGMETPTKEELQGGGFFNMDCMQGMKEFADGFFDLAIVDPPYGIGIAKNPVRQAHDKKEWDNHTPDKAYFEELFRVSKRQIIWGGNYYDLPPTQNFVIWDKVQPEDLTLAMCEVAWCSIQSPMKIFRYSVMREKNKIHPTQKPVALYAWLLTKYAKQGDKILDTHVGSASSLIACHNAGFSFWGFEIDPDYYKAAKTRLDNAAAQYSILDYMKPQAEEYEQATLFTI